MSEKRNAVEISMKTANVIQCAEKSVPHTESRKPREPYMKKRRSSAPSKYLLA